MVESDLKADLVLEGGGVKGIALVGAVSALEEAGYTFERLAGTSAGAIVAAFLAAGTPLADLEDLMRSTDYRQFRDGNFLSNLGPIGQSLSLLRFGGIYRGDYFADWLDNQLFQLCDYPSNGDSLTFGDVADDTMISERLVVMVSDLCAQRLVRLPWEYQSRYGLDPTRQTVASAVRASMSIPYFFEPVSLTHSDGEVSTLVDGGLLSNFPIDVFDVAPNVNPRWPTFGLKLSSRSVSRELNGSIDGPFEMTSAMVATMLNASDSAHLDKPDTTARTIFIDTYGISPVDFDLDPTDIAMLYQSGRSAVKTFLETWDFDDYIRTYRD